MAQPHIHKAVLIDILGPLQEKHSFRRVDLFLVEAVDEGGVGLEFASDEVADLDVELGGGALKEECALLLVAVQLSDLQLIDVGELRDPLVEYALFKPFERHPLPVPKLLNLDVRVNNIGNV